MMRLQSLTKSSIKDCLYSNTRDDETYNGVISHNWIDLINVVRIYYLQIYIVKQNFCQKKKKVVHLKQKKKKN